MPQLTFKNRLSLWFSLILAVCLFLAGISFAVGYFGVTLVNLQNFMLREAKEVSEKHLTQIDGKIFFKRDSEGKTLSAYLRDESLSAMVIDKRMELIGSYGVYNGLLETQKKESLFDENDLKKSLLDGKYHFSFHQLYEGRTYLTLIYPEIMDGNVVGALMLGADMDLGRQMLIFSLILLALVLPISFLIGWGATHFMVGKSFSPLEDILKKMNDINIENLPEKILIKGNQNDEIVRLSRSYNEMIYRLGEGIQKQKEFVQNASHELKTPLTETILSLDIIEMDIKDGKSTDVLKGLRAVKKDLKKYGDLINSLLEISRIKQESKRIPKILPKEIINSVIDGYEKKVKEKKLEINLNVDNSKKIIIPEEHFEIIFSNLFSNAIKYSVEDKIIDINFKTQGKNRGILEISNSVSDNKLNLKKIWKRLYRGGNYKSAIGYGIGLSVVKEIADQNKLKISNSLINGTFSISVSGFKLG